MSRLRLTCVIGLSALATAASAAEFRVIGYMPSWNGSNASVQYDKLTIINYAFGNPNADGTLQPIPNASKLTDLVSRAHARNVKVVLSLGGWNGGNDSNFETLAASSTRRTTFVNSCVNVLNQYNLDGIDVDWEYPDPGTSATNYGMMMNQLCGAMHSRGKTCSAAVISHGTQGGGVPASVFSYIDYIMLMAYDGGAGSANSPYSLAVTSMDYWQGRGLPSSKTVLGVPFYGRGPSFSNYRLYNEIVALDAQAPYKDFSNGYGYNGIDTIKRKTQLAMSRGGGIMNWELSGDTTGTTSLMLAIDQVVKGPGSTPTPTPTPTAPSVTPTPTPTPTPAGDYTEITPPGAMVTASTADTNVPANTVDNNLGTRWSGNGDGTWIKYDLGSARLVSHVTVAVYQGNARRNRFEIQTSSDNVTWTTRFNGESSGTTTNEETYDIADTSARYVRYLGHGNFGATNTFMNSVTEVSVFTPNMPPPPTPTPTATPIDNPPTPTPTVPVPTPTATPTPVATPIEVTPPASSVTASTSDGNLPGNTVDNSLLTRWSANGDGQWLQLNLGGVRRVTHVRVAAYQGNGRRNRFDIQTSNGGGLWTTVLAGAQTSGTTTAEETFDLADTDAQWIRYVGHGATLNTGSSSSWNSVTEVSVFAVP